MERHSDKANQQGGHALNLKLVRSAATAKPVRTGAMSPPARSADARLRVLVADDHPVVRKGMISALSGSPGIEVVGEAADGHEALRLARELSPDIMLLDISMPRMNGLAVTEMLRAERPKLRILVLSAHQTPEFVLRVLRAGASGYLLKEARPAEILQALETVHRGDLYFSPQVAHVALNQFVRRVTSGPGPNDLSNREREILTHIAEGLSNKEIATRLNIGTRTVETHRERLMRKLNIHSIAGLTRFAIVNGFLPVPELAL